MVVVTVPQEQTVTLYRATFVPSGYVQSGYHDADELEEIAERKLARGDCTAYEIERYEVTVRPLKQRSCAGCGAPSGILWWCSTSCQIAEDGEPW